MEKEGIRFMMEVSTRASGIKENIMVSERYVCSLPRTIVFGGFTKRLA